MNGKDAEGGQQTTDINTIPASPYNTEQTALVDQAKNDRNVELTTKKKKNIVKGLCTFLYNPRRKTVLGRDSLNWGKLAVFYTIFYFCLGCFFTGLLYVFAQITDRTIPTYYNTESTMAVRTTATVVGMGFRPQPFVHDSLIPITNDLNEQERFATSLGLYRTVYLTQKNNARIEQCSNDVSPVDLPQGVACAFDWNDIVNTDNHPCSEKNLYGFKNQEPCVLVKLNKVYGWMPTGGHTPFHIQKLQNSFNNKTVVEPDVYVTCAGSQPADNDVLNNMIYYSLGDPSGSSKYGVIPNYFFPYRNAPDHVQPFVLVQFKDLPLNRLISVTCKAWAPNIEHDTRGMRGMVSFQLYRSNEAIQSKKDL